jgi:hypothetical protein
VATAFAAASLPRALSRYTVVWLGRTTSVPLVSTAPIPLSISAVCAPSTSHESVAADPAGISPGVTMNFWIASPSAFVRLSITPHEIARIEGLRTGLPHKNAMRIGTYLVNVK